MKMTDNIFMIDLTQFTETDTFLSKLEISNFLVQCGFSGNLEELSNYIYCVKNGMEFPGKPSTLGKPWYKAWFFRDTLNVFGIENIDGKNFTNDFIQFLFDLESIKPIKKIDEKQFSKSLDDVLDKIGKYGIESLSPYELEILKKS